MNAMTEPKPPEEPTDSEMLERARWLLSQIIQSLPARRDWLDPDIEKEARAAITNAMKEKP